MKRLIFVTIVFAIFVLTSCDYNLPIITDNHKYPFIVDEIKLIHSTHGNYCIYYSTNQGTSKIGLPAGQYNIGDTIKFNHFKN